MFKICRSSAISHCCTPAGDTNSRSYRIDKTTFIRLQELELKTIISTIARYMLGFGRPGLRRWLVLGFLSLLVENLGGTLGPTPVP